MPRDDDLNLKDMSDEELAKAPDLSFDLAQTTNDSDPPHTHGGLRQPHLGRPEAPGRQPAGDQQGMIGPSAANIVGLPSLEGRPVPMTVGSATAHGVGTPLFPLSSSPWKQPPFVSDIDS